MAVSSKGQKIPDWGKRPRGNRSGSAPRLIKRLPGDAATTVFTDWFLDANATSGVTLSLATTTGPAVFACGVSLGIMPEVVYLRVAAQDRSMGVNYNRFPIVVPFQARSMAVGVSRLPMRVLASPRLMRVA